MNKERRKRISEAVELIGQALDILEEVKDEEQESYDNLPEGNTEARGLEEFIRGMEQEALEELLEDM